LNLHDFEGSVQETAMANVFLWQTYFFGNNLRILYDASVRLPARASYVDLAAGHAFKR
jgi:hypothetical protein